MVLSNNHEFYTATIGKSEFLFIYFETTPSYSKMINVLKQIKIYETDHTNIDLLKQIKVNNTKISDLKDILKRVYLT